VANRRTIQSEVNNYAGARHRLDASVPVILEQLLASGPSQSWLGQWMKTCTYTQRWPALPIDAGADAENLLIHHGRGLRLLGGRS